MFILKKTKTVKAELQGGASNQLRTNMSASVYSLMITAMILITKVSLISSIKFGFILRDEENLFSEKFVAFGVLPKDVTVQERIDISDHMNWFYQHHSNEKQRSFGVDAKKFSIKLFDQLKLPNGNHQVALKGDLSNFLAHFQFSVINAAEPLPIWQKAKFYSDPIANVYESTLDKYREGVKVLLLRAAFYNFDILPNNDLKLVDRSLTFADMNSLSSPVNDDFDDDFTVIEFYPSSDSLRNSLVDSPRQKSYFKSKCFKRDRSGCSHCTIC